MDTVSREIKQKNGLTYWLLFLILDTVDIHIIVYYSIIITY